MTSDEREYVAYRLVQARESLEDARALLAIGPSA